MERALSRQDEILRYLEHGAKCHDLKRDIQFSTRVTAGEYDEENNLRRVHTDKGETVTCHTPNRAVTGMG